MSDDPSYGNRKSKNDKRAKRRFRVYKKGGKERTMNIWKDLNITWNYIKYNKRFNKMETISKVKAIGGSLMVRIPKDLVVLESIREGELVKIKIKKIKKSGFGLLKGMRSFKEEDEFDTHA